MEKLKILLVEDDARQIEWAKKCFKKHRLTICESEKAFLANDPTSFDCVITDLFLPKSKGEQPDYQVGLNIYKQLVELTNNNQLKACALLSNFEHHCDKMNFDVMRSLKEEFEKTKNDINIFVEFDISWDAYKYFMSPDMKITTKEEIREMGKNGTFYCGGIVPEAVAVKNYGYIFLKRYPEILERIEG